MGSGPCKGPDTPHQCYIFHFLAPRFVGLKNGRWTVSGSHLEDFGDKAGALTEGLSALPACMCASHGMGVALRFQTWREAGPEE